MVNRRRRRVAEAVSRPGVGGRRGERADDESWGCIVNRPTGLCVGIPVEIKPGEHRVAGLPADVRRLVERGCRVVVQRTAGAGSGYCDDDYASAGAVLVPDLASVYERADIVWKVKEVLPAEFGMVRRGQVIFTYLHAPPRPELVRVLRDSGCIAIAYEEMVDGAGRRPLLAPMSRMAGAGGVLLAGQFCQTRHRGCGKLLFATEGAAAMTFTILGAGVAGCAAARAALAAGATVHLLEAVRDKLPDLRRALPEADVVTSAHKTLCRLLPETDVLMNCTYWMPGDAHLVTRGMLSLMRRGSLIMDIAADAHGAIETSETTTHDDPLRDVDGVLHYCVQNIPALFARSASEALSAATRPHLEHMASEGVDQAVRECGLLRSGVVLWRGTVVGAELGRIQALDTLSSDDLLPLLEAE